MKCKNCGISNSKQAQFCMECGQELKKRKLKLWQVGLCVCIVLLVVFCASPSVKNIINNKETNHYTTDDNTFDKTQEIPEVDIDNNNIGHIRMLSLGGYHSACVTNDGSLYMWGGNEYGQLGDGSLENRTIPTKIMDKVMFVSLGDLHSAAITEDGTLYVWGFEYYDGENFHANMAPTKIMDNVISVSLGYSHSAAITSDGSLYMWGANNYGQLGDGTYEDKYTPTKVMDSIMAVSLGAYHSAALDTDGSLYLWGYNNFGELGDGTYENRNIPTKILDNVMSVSLSGFHSAATTKDESLFEWGMVAKEGISYATISNPTKILMEDVELLV